MIPVKICGLTRLQDAALAWERGASALGFVFHPPSPRAMDADAVAAIRRALPPDAFCVGVFVDRDPDEVNRLADRAGLDAVQLHGRETPETCAAVERPVIKAIRAGDEARLGDYPVAAFLLDAVHPTLAGGTGLQADWDLAARLARRVPLVLAGGLRPANIREAAETVFPAALDASSGVEVAPGLKDAALLRLLLGRIVTPGQRPPLLSRNPILENGHAH